MPEISQWEYLAMTIGSTFKTSKDAEIEIRLNEIGEQGWEVVSAYQIANTNKLRIIARRHLTITVKRQRSLPAY